MSGMCGDIEEDRAVLRSYPRTAPEAELGTQFDRLVDDRMRAEPRRCQLTTLTEVVATHGLDRIDLLKIDVERPRPMCSPESTRAPGKESTRSSLRCPTWTAGCGPYWTNWRGAASGVSSGSGRGAVGLSLFVVDSDSPGIAIERIEPVGWRAADPATVRFESVRVPVDHVVGRQGSGFYQLERVVAAALALGGADRNLQLTREHLVHRRAFGARLADLPAVRHRVADLATDLAAARELVYHAVWRYQSDDLGSVRECSMAKLCATELATRIADTSLQLHGAHGYLDDTEVARAFRDSRPVRAR